MNDLEDALRDALATRATAVRPDPAAYDAVLARRRGRLAMRWTRPLGTVATAVVVAGLVVVAGRVSTTPGRSSTGPSAQPGTKAPERVATIADGRAVVLDSDLTKVIAVSAEEYGFVGWVAAAGDGRTFYAAGTDLSATCHARSRLFKVGGGDVPGGPADGLVRSLVVSPDGQRLAYDVIAPDKTGNTCRGSSELRVRDLATGAERLWPVPVAKSPGYAAIGKVSVLDELSWSPDGRYLAFSYNGYGFVRLDTTAPGSAVPPPPPIYETSVPDPDPGAGTGAGCTIKRAAYLGTTGELVAFLTCTGHEAGSGSTTGVWTYDPRARKAVREVFRADHVAWVAFDRSGTHAFFVVSTGPGSGETLYRWDEGGAPRKVRTGSGVRVEGLSW